MGDPRKITKLMLNTLVAAINGRGRMRVRLDHPAGKWAVLTVNDDGSDGFVARAGRTKAELFDWLEGVVWAIERGL